MRRKAAVNAAYMKESGRRITRAIKEKYSGRNWLDQFCEELQRRGAPTSKAMIIKYRHGQTMIPAYRAFAFAEVLGVSVEYLMAMDFPKPEPKQKLPELSEADYLISRVAVVKALAELRHIITNTEWNAIMRALASVPPAELEAINTTRGIQIEIYKEN